MNLKVVIMLPLAIIGLLLLMVVDLIRMIQGRPTIDEEWHSDYIDSNLNNGQGREYDD